MTASTDGILRGYLSDNAAGAPPEILEALSAAAVGPAAPYANDPLSARVRHTLAEVFEHPVDVFLVGTGSAANGISLAALTPPWGAVLAHPNAHINNDEAGAPEFFTNGAKIVGVDGPNSKIAPTALYTAARRMVGDVHCVQPSVVSLTQATETGSVYSLAELHELGGIARTAGLRVHLDGARFANALVSLNASPADMSWRAGVDVLSFGATKNGALTADAILSFDPSLSTQLAFRHKRGGQLTSKMRFQSAQVDAYLRDDLWLRNARHANAMAARLATGLAGTTARSGTPTRGIPGVRVLGSVDANIIFVQLAEPIAAALTSAGFGFYGGRWDPGVFRFVTSFAHQASDIDALIEAVVAAGVS